MKTEKFKQIILEELDEQFNPTACFSEGYEEMTEDDLEEELRNAFRTLFTCAKSRDMNGDS